MTVLLPYPKPANIWTGEELKALNVHVERIDPLKFFGVLSLPDCDISANILSENTSPSQGKVGLSREERLFFEYLQDAHTGKVAMIDDFAAFLLHMLGFDDAPGRVIHTRVPFSITMCDFRVDATSNISLWSRFDSDLDCILVVQCEDKAGGGTTPAADARLIATAIAAFDQSNIRRTAAGQPCYDKRTIFGVVMKGTSPYFYRVPVCRELVLSLAGGYRPSHVTVVKACAAASGDLDRYAQEGMMSLLDRKCALQCFQALKASLAPL
ncbi:hypothetical protein CVT26_014094 [Gymnopilus dilepis]|uniref:Uncharacterized protein n=1 Tax=Gymnopilus dilepis TaxID=231916 RepID=A0A409Y8E3_9AGAR|nr:hypothetical protein CVT26_014094 [Gymnopilus dilepis]